MKRPESVDEYIASTPKEIRARLKELRSTIKAAAPKAEERISYGMPYYDYKGRLAYFRLAKKHIGLYIPPPVVEEHKNELTAYKTHRATIQLPLDKNLPIALIKKLVRARARKNDARAKNAARK